MATFRYQSLTRTGESRTGVLDAPDRAAAVRQLLSRGETATSMDQFIDSASEHTNGHASKAVRMTRSGTPGKSAGFTGFSLSQTKVSRTEMSNFIRELATALEAGLPLMQSLRTVRKQAANKGLADVLDHLIQRIEAGAPLHQAAREYGEPFDDMIVGMLRAADASGEMSVILHQLADLLERSIELRREVMGALFYPIILMVLLTVSVIILVTVLVPKLIAPLAGTITMPWPTQVVLTGADFFGNYWMFCIGGITAIVVLFRMWLKSPENRFRFDRAKLRSPIAGKLLRDVAVARFTRTLGTLVEAGLPILDALRITSGTLGNAALTAAIGEVQEQVTSGKSLAAPMERSGLFPPLLIQVINLGERTGRLEKMLIHAASAFDRQVNNSIKIFTQALQPVVLIVMAGAAGFILAAILLPLLELQSMVK